MAQITGKTDEKVYRILKWLGLNENPDGDTKLELGEASEMRNFRVTRDGNLQKRPGMDKVVLLGEAQTFPQISQTAKTDVHVCSQLVMHESVSLDAMGFVTVSGQEAVVTFENWQNYVGWYWVYNKYYTWRLNALAYDEGTDTYTWTMTRILAEQARIGPPVGGRPRTYWPVIELWAGNVNGTEYVMGVCEDHLYRLCTDGVWEKTDLGLLPSDNIFSTYPRIKQAHLFGYSNKLYILTAYCYKEWDGTTLKDVEGYVPIVAMSIDGTNGGAEFDPINLLSKKRRVWISPNGTATTFGLPEKDLTAIGPVKDRATGENVPAADYDVDLAAGTVTFHTAPAAAVNSYEITYSVDEDGRETILKMKYSEFFNGENDNRVFLYGDGSNQAIYSGLDYDGNPRADYFPDGNTLVVGDANTPITGMIRHYSRLLVFKTHSTYSVQYSVETLSDGSVYPFYYATPVNRDIGNAAPGQVRLVLNAPFTLHGKDLFEWRNTSAYSSNLSIDERQAKRVSDRIAAALAGFDLAKCYCWDDNDNQEYYICYDSKALVYNYVADAWYLYDNFPVTCMCNFRGDLYVADEKGAVHRLDQSVRSDNGDPFRCYWESGSIPFDREFMRKYSAMLWVGIKPEGKAQVNVTVQTDRKSVYTEKLVASSLASFAAADFRHWSFNVNRKPHQKRLKIKAKKFVYYKLIFFLEDRDKTVTVLNTDLRVRYTGYAR